MTAETGNGNNSDQLELQQSSQFTNQLCGSCLTFRFTLQCGIVAYICDATLGFRFLRSGFQLMVLFWCHYLQPVSFHVWQFYKYNQLLKHANQQNIVKAGFN